MGLFTNNLITRADTIPRHIRGITCDAKNCVYHDGDNFCTAERVTIGRINAINSSETRCATFELRGEITR
ncbi:MAG: DUF1540 domain-containing protein [Clostridia bacterium]|nr:DUF1540 domain-containing protein [Clostridia bacterium]